MFRTALRATYGVYLLARGSLGAALRQRDARGSRIRLPIS